jgi:SAM-dependent methyltransferase
MADVAPDLRGRDVVHIQCHIGFDTIALARRGARVTGVDFSRASLAKAAELAERCGVEIEWVQANATALPDSLRGGFEVAYATIGAICWIEDIGAWMRSAAATLRPGGRLVLVEIHPLYAMVEAAGRRCTRCYCRSPTATRRRPSKRRSAASPGGWACWRASWAATTRRSRISRRRSRSSAGCARVRGSRTRSTASARRCWPAAGRGTPTARRRCSTRSAVGYRALGIEAWAARAAAAR